jgi:predicted P-loop ATPase
LHGDQGGLKSTFFKNLASPAWFCDTQLGSINKDLYIRMHSCWIYEIAELETFTTKREAGAVKGLLSSAEDRFRPPYGRSSDVFKRSGIFVASVNLDGFLVDRTGNRRFMVIRLPRQQGHKIPIHLAERDRDAIWRAFVLAYDAGIKPILNEAEQKANEEANQACLSEAAFEGPLGRWLVTNGVAQKEFTIDDCLHQSGARDLSHITETDKRKAGELLRSWGYDRKQKRVDGVRYWVWFKVSPLSHDTCHTRSKKEKKEGGVH